MVALNPQFDWAIARALAPPAMQPPDYKCPHCGGHLHIRGDGTMVCGQCQHEWKSADKAA